MTISAKIIADSISDTGIRLITYELRYPRFIHAELMTHRVFSRNASSSRAIPVKKMIEDLRRDPAMPVSWGKNQKGMQAGEDLHPDAVSSMEVAWLSAMNEAIVWATRMMNDGLHKQIANRLLEPWAHINVVVTATDYENFFALRMHPDAQPEMQALAHAMWVAREESTPELVLSGQWHLPYVPHWERADIVKAVTGKDWDQFWDQSDYSAMAKVSVARCARVSYLTHDGKRSTIAEDLALYNRLVGSMPLHASPAEHQASPDHKVPDDYDVMVWNKPNLHGNLRGWRQYRKTMPGEFVTG